MTNEPTTKIDSVKAFVKKNKAPLAYSAGVAVGITGMILGISTRTLIEITPAASRTLKEGGVVLCNTKNGTIAMAFVPALQKVI